MRKAAGTSRRRSPAAPSWNDGNLARQVKAQVDEAIRRDRLKPSEAMKLLASYERALKDYTYLQLNGAAVK
jgi:arginine decarboxylase